jgi:uncharacterized protein YkwD
MLLVAMGACLASPAATAAPTPFTGATAAVDASPARAGAVKPTAIELSFLRAINDTRAARGLSRLRLNLDLVRAARSHSQDMVERAYFGHGPVGRRLARFGVSSGTRGENLGWGSTLDDAVPTLIRMWLRSPTHRFVLLSDQFRQAGVGIEIGRFQGCEGAIVVTVDFWSG